MFTLLFTIFTLLPTVFTLLLILLTQFTLLLTIFTLLIPMFALLITIPTLPPTPLRTDHMLLQRITFVQHLYKCPPCTTPNDARRAPAEATRTARVHHISIRTRVAHKRELAKRFTQHVSS